MLYEVITVTRAIAGGASPEVDISEVTLQAYRRDFPAQLDADRFELVS